jgi:hypothetical protein
MCVLESERFAKGRCIQPPKVVQNIVLSLISLGATILYAPSEVSTTFVEVEH